MNKLILLIAIIVIAIVAVFFILPRLSIWYFWSNPLEEKRAATANVQNSLDAINQLNNMISVAIETGNTESLTETELPSGVTWTVDTSDNSISLSLTSKVSNLASDVGWVQISSSNYSVVSGKSDRSNNVFQIQYKIKLNDPWKIESVGKTTSSNAKQIDVNKENSAIKILFVE